ncbi:unnamed protein product [Polarella glacialis]|uniref:Uncharacterized protein n=1 Tax=Polarella glacialis TaxID=89957 RepID=A0A813KIM5_POLGL|nr:unnamed protein product [Polarella glacialis]
MHLRTALVELHQALEAEGEVHEDSEGEIPAFVRLHALRILQQAKGNVTWFCLKCIVVLSFLIVADRCSIFYVIILCLGRFLRNLFCCRFVHFWCLEPFARSRRPS